MLTGLDTESPIGKIGRPIKNVDSHLYQELLAFHNLSHPNTPYSPRIA